MSLDIVILGRNGKPESQVRCELGVHDQLIKIVVAKKESFSLLERLKDYYSDTRYQTEELSGLLDEIKAAVPRTKHQELIAFLMDFEGIVRKAIDQNSSLEAIAD